MPVTTAKILPRVCLRRDKICQATHPLSIPPQQLRFANHIALWSTKWEKGKKNEICTVSFDFLFFWRRHDSALCNQLFVQYFVWRIQLQSCSLLHITMKQKLARTNTTSFETNVKKLSGLLQPVFIASVPYSCDLRRPGNRYKLKIMTTAPDFVSIRHKSNAQRWVSLAHFKGNHYSLHNLSAKVTACWALLQQ